ncbi:MULTISPECIES: FtsW/RodA/SpoVE family cell cycle protein [unclassified Inquilinus]|uniref:FtsW/RodA/SpoVE family cell cycle protein n=1 Tax=unclassified Inquilinus TaxID=2645927 RepID=UPI003F93831D
MVTLDRADSSVIGRWWWTVDRWMLLLLGIIMGIGAILILAASPAVAQRIHLGEFHFIERHLMMLVPAVGLMFLVSLMSPPAIRRTAAIVFVLSLLGVFATLFVGVEIKGATRWVQLPGMSVQPSEFVKPAFAVVAAWLFAQQKMRRGFPGYVASTVLYCMIVALLLSQPDLGMTVVITAVWFIQFFIAGLPMFLVIGLIGMGTGGLVGSYFLFDHVRSRIDRFLDPAAGDNYQVDRAIEAFTNGGLFGTGPGEGTVKLYLPDAHADFIFAVGGEEFGLFFCLLLVALFAFIVVRGLSRVMNETNLFIMLAVVGLVTQFGLQAAINMASTLHLIPTKGMTLPFVSYGGSSLIALGYGMGMVLALTRRHAGSGGVR